MLNHVSSRSLFNDLLKMMSGIIMDRDPQICQTQRDERERERDPQTSGMLARMSVDI